jgi:hypothetical protein
MLFIKDCLYRLKGSQRVMILGQLNKHKYHKTYGYSIVLCLPVRRGAPGHLVSLKMQCCTYLSHSLINIITQAPRTNFARPRKLLHLPNFTHREIYCSWFHFHTKQVVFYGGNEAYL